MKNINQLLLCLFSVVLTACPSHVLSTTIDEEPASSETNPSMVQVGKRNFWEVNAAMATVAGIPPQMQLALNAGQAMSGGVGNAGGGKGQAGAGSDGDGNSMETYQKITEAWLEVSSMMARKNSIDGCDPSTQVGVFRLASAYCNHLVNNKTAWDSFVKKNFDDAQVSKLSKSHIATVMLDSLQTGSKLSSEQREKSIATIVNYMNDSSTGDSVSQETLFDVCTMVLGSASSMLN